MFCYIYLDPELSILSGAALFAILSFPKWTYSNYRINYVVCKLGVLEHSV